MMLVISTQVYENYAWNEDGSLGTGADAYWKPKGGRDYKVLGVPLNIDYESVVAAAGVEVANDGYTETVIGWSIESDDYMSEFEQQQLDYMGKIDYPDPTMEYSDLVARAA